MFTFEWYVFSYEAQTSTLMPWDLTMMPRYDLDNNGHLNARDFECLAVSDFNYYCFFLIFSQNYSKINICVGQLFQQKITLNHKITKNVLCPGHLFHKTTKIIKFSRSSSPSLRDGVSGTKPGEEICFRRSTSKCLLITYHHNPKLQHHHSDHHHHHHHNIKINIIVDDHGHNQLAAKTCSRRIMSSSSSSSSSSSLGQSRPTAGMA